MLACKTFNVYFQNFGKQQSSISAQSDYFNTKQLIPGNSYRNYFKKQGLEANF